ncbi:MAG: molybdopterin-binding protein [Alistipes indistinctus]
MQAEIITIGDELLIGQVVDTNSAWLGRTLGEDGIKVTQITSVQDDADQIARTVNEALARVSIVLVTGDSALPGTTSPNIRSRSCSV